MVSLPFLIQSGNSDFREQAQAYVTNPTTWDSKRGLKRSWQGEPRASGSSSSGATPKQDKKPTSSEKGKKKHKPFSQFKRRLCFAHLVL